MAIAIGLVFVLPLLARAQNSDAVSFTAYADAREVIQNSYLEVTFTLKNADGTNFTPPRFQDFQVLSGPSQGFQTTIVNGRMSKEITYSYRLQPQRKGKLTIGPASITVGGRTLQTQPLDIAVVAGGAQAGDGSVEVYLKARLSPAPDAGGAVYLGQQLAVDYVLYTRVDVQGLTAASESTYDGFFMREVHQYDNRVVREVVNGVQYVSRILKRVILYPQQTGPLTIDPLAIVVSVPLPGQRPSGFFSRPDMQRVPIASQAIRLNVKLLPQPQPADFSDITGNFTLTAAIAQQTVTTDDALSLVLTFEGEGDLKRVQAPHLNFPADFEVYDPKVLEEDYIDVTAGSKGRKKFEYLLVPKKAGSFTLQPRVVVFNTDSMAYQTLTPPPLSVNIRQGSGEKRSGLVVAAPGNQGLYPPRQTIRLATAGGRFFGTPVFWGLLLLPIVVTGSWLAYRQVQSSKPPIDPVWLKQQRARQAALARLQAADQHRQANESRAFYDEVERALLGYVSDKRQIARADLTKANVLAQIQELGASDAARDQFMDLLRTCEMALYAGKDNADAMEATYTQAVTLLAEMEEAAR
jgi:hypothetical protein